MQGPEACSSAEHVACPSPVQPANRFIVCRAPADGLELADGERRLAAIMFTDIVGYTSLTQGNEALAMEVLEEHRKVVRPFLPKHDGKEVKTIGDAFLIEFASALEAVRCAFEIQQSLGEMAAGQSPERRIKLRIGVHVGDVIHSQNDVYGDAVNIASRIEPLAQPGGICVSEQVYYQIKNKFELPLRSIGRKELKNIAEPAEVFKVVLPWEEEAAGTGGLDQRRIAVLPFANFSPDPSDGYFADGITEEIISTVSGISGLSVISRTSVMGYKGTTKKVDEIGRELKVGSVLEGSFRKAGNRIRVTAQLIDVVGDRHVWAQNYDRNLDDVFAVQSDVARQVSEALRVRILVPEDERIGKRPTESTAAYTMYLKGRSYWNLRGSENALENVTKALGCFEESVKEDPNFALGYVGQSDCRHKLCEFGIEVEANMQQSELEADKALQMDPSLAEAHATRATVLTSKRDYVGAEKEFKKAIELKPGYASAHHWYFLMLHDQLRWTEALEQIQRAAELDPLSPIICYLIGHYHYDRCDYPRALEQFRRSVELGGSSMRWAVALTYGRMKLFDDMKREYGTWVDAVKAFDPSARVSADSEIAYFLGDKETVRRLLPEVEARYGKPYGPSALRIASSYFFLGEDDEGFKWLERSASGNVSNFFSADMQTDVEAKRLKGDPRYVNLLRRLGLDRTPD